MTPEHYMAMLAAGALALSGCGVPDALPLELHEVTTCSFGAVHVHAEFPISCTRFESNFALAKRMFTALKLPDEFTNVEVNVWDRQVLMCDQYFLGACVHLVKGLSNEGGRTQWIDLNNGGELLLHEMLHFAEHPMDPDHTHWASNGFALADKLFRWNSQPLN